MFRSFSATALAAALSFFVIGAAGAQVSNPGEVYPTVDDTTFLALFIEAGIGFQIAQVEGGGSLISVNISEGKTLLIGLDSCGRDGSGCKSMAMAAVSSSAVLPFSTLGQNLLAMNLINERLPYGKYMIVEGVPMATRYDVFVNGITKGTLFANIITMSLAAETYFQILAGLEQSNNETAFNNSLNSAEDVVKDQNSVEGMASRLSLLPLAEGTSKTLFSSIAFQRLIKSKQFMQENTWSVDANDLVLPSLTPQNAK